MLVLLKCLNVREFNTIFVSEASNLVRFKDKKIKKIFVQQNIWITFLSIIIGLPSGYFLTSWLFKACLDDNFDFNVYINISTYIIATIGTFLVSYIVSKLLTKKINKIDMVSSLKGNE